MADITSSLTRRIIKLAVFVLIRLYPGPSGVLFRIRVKFFSREENVISILYKYVLWLNRRRLIVE